MSGDTGTRTCDACTEPAVVFDPGSAEIRDRFLLQRGVPLRCWCLRHWGELFGIQATDA